MIFFQIFLYREPVLVAVSIGKGDEIKIGYGKFNVSLRPEFWPGNPENLNKAVLRVVYEIVW